MGPTWVLSALGGPHVGPINLAVRVPGTCKTSASVWWAWVFTSPSTLPIHQLLMLFQSPSINCQSSILGVTRKSAHLGLLTSTLIARFMGPIWGRQGPGGPHVGPMNFAIWVGLLMIRNDINYDNGNENEMITTIFMGVPSGYCLTHWGQVMHTVKPVI